MLNDKSGVFSVWLRDNLPNTISKEEFDKLNKTLHEKVSARSASVGGLSEEVGTKTCHMYLCGLMGTKTCVLVIIKGKWR